MKKIFLILTLAAAMLLSAATALAAAPSVMDNANLLSPDELIRVEQALEQCEREYNVRIGVVTAASIGDQKPGDFANALIDEAYNDGVNGNMVLLQVIDQRKWYISTDKKLKEVIVGNEGVEYMSKAFVPYLKKEDYAEAYIIYANKAGELLAYYEENGEGWTPDKEFPWLGVLGSLAFGALAAFIYRLGLLATMSNVRKQVEANVYLNKESFSLLATEDTYMYSTVSVVPLAKHNNNNNDADGSVTDSSSDGDHGGGGGDY
ncbi:MAG: TPM domain-containing protein [Phascolarctobacterium sp.]|uniref:TPM domain-containing protein n=1 Tax=Phascolarctobacterium sp. TaxID=2049039 RepID=UPI0026DC9E55|nr:TPM domain-containing protein [Phascolarctobacterium sp.]MDO4921846.1 TPM domain-containing protein [Phascolarctobacterium sp.]